MASRFLERGGAWVLGQGLMMVVVVAAGALSRRDPAWPNVVGLGGVLMVLGGLLGLAGAVALRSGLTPFPEPEPTAPFVRHGVYSLVRHPLYSSLLITSYGWALFRQSWPALLAAIVFTVFLDAKARREERWLRERFPAYRAYAQRVRRFIPWVY